jgi:predicted enzyme related to lactoylglutathione lyase
MTPDTEGAKPFYAGMFGWETESMVMGEMGEYTMFTRGGGQGAGGMVAIQPEMGPTSPHWLAYFAVAEVDDSHGRALTLGAQSVVAPTDIPGAGRFAVIMDPTGAVFGIYHGNKKD